jgi:hypothetical protein
MSTEGRFVTRVRALMQRIVEINATVQAINAYLP